MATVELFAVGNTRTQQAKHIIEQSRLICLLGIKSARRLGRAATPEDGSHYEALLKKGRLFLQWLDTIEMTLEIKEKHAMDKLLGYILDDCRCCFPPDIIATALGLRDKWERENWGRDVVVEEEEGSSTNQSPDEDVASPSPVASTEEEAQIVQSELPSPDHPIYGDKGIMHGVLIVRSAKGRRTHRLNPLIPKRSAKVFGHNGIAAGTWFANQLVALHRGAHGSRIGGIAGSTALGAYSIVVASNYEDLDYDKGETLYYSGSNSHDNTDPLRPAPSRPGTRALKASIETRNPVRVLRSGGAPNSPRANSWLPECGLRYDGLYRVVALHERKNKKGGLYEQFVLHREPDQTPLNELKRTSPTTQQRLDLVAIQQGY
ncbi:PUA-like domain-containing protein [Hypoxylon sp. FL1284]|nr:PUA-like domain-containing protein [Hypoxylon sp. FL1284]